MSKKMSSSLLAELLMSVVPKAMQNIREEMRKGRGDQLTIPQFRVLASVNRGICYNKEIGERLGVSEAAISRMVDILVTDGLLKKATSKSDRRQSVLSLTSEGQKLYNTCKQEAHGRLKMQFDSMPEDELKITIEGLLLLQKHLAQVNQ